MADGGSFITAQYHRGNGLESNIIPWCKQVPTSTLTQRAKSRTPTKFSSGRGTD